MITQREILDKMGIAYSLFALGHMAYNRREYDVAWMMMAESLVIQREAGGKNALTRSLYNLGLIAYAQGNYVASRTLYEECLPHAREAGPAHPYLMHVLGGLGHLARAAGDYTQASTHYQESLLLRQKQGDALVIAQSIEDFSGPAGRQGQFARAAHLLGAAEALCTPLGRTQPVAEPDEYEHTVTAAREALGEAAFMSAWEEGCALTQEQAIAFALESHPCA